MRPRVFERATDDAFLPISCRKSISRYSPGASAKGSLTPHSLAIAVQSQPIQISAPYNHQTEALAPPEPSLVPCRGGALFSLLPKNVRAKAGSRNDHRRRAEVGPAR